MARRKSGTLVPLEIEILETALALQRSGQPSIHGFGLAAAMREAGRSRSLTAHGTLYKALGRLEELGLVTSHWEDESGRSGRPRRRLYQVTGEGARVVNEAHLGEVTATTLRRAEGPA